jgi:hypothetical protein
MLICIKCKQPKWSDEFPVKNELTQERYKTCTECFVLKHGDLNLFFANKKQNKKKSRKSRKNKCQDFVKELLQKSSCKDCGIADWEVLEFDHRIPAEKYKSITTILKYGSISLLKPEIEKCDIVCANCHRKRTIKQFNHWRNNF